MNRNKPKITATIYDKRGRILSVGENSYEKTNTYQARLAKKIGQPHRIYLHSEIQAIIRCRTGVPYSIRIERYDVHGNPKLAKPCPICELAIKEAGIKEVTYTVG